MNKPGFVYIVTNRRNGTLYIGVTSNLAQRIWQHREGFVDGFTRKHGLKRLVWFQDCGSIVQAIVREKQMKTWHRLWKLRVIEEMNPEWNDLFDTLV